MESPRRGLEELDDLVELGLHVAAPRPRLSHQFSVSILTKTLVITLQMKKATKTITSSCNDVTFHHSLILKA